MGLRINTNVVSQSAQRTLSITNQDQAESLTKLSSGKRINKAADDAAGLAISEKLRAKIRGTTQAERNANDGISLIQTAEGGLNEIANILIRLRELSIQSASDTVGNQEREFANLEYEQLKTEIQRISNSTEFNGKKLLNGEGEKYDFQIGIFNVPNEDRISYDASVINSGVDSLNISDANVLSKEDAQGSLDPLDTAIQKISGQRAILGAIQNRLGSTINNLQISNENLNAANSRIIDTDYASETSNNVRNNILTQAGTSVLAQANVRNQAALKLI
ncbi:MAG: flagellin [Bdellovibrionales bacterium]|nr:flagellin [Bdellovibrionales bacterium]